MAKRVRNTQLFHDVPLEHTSAQAKDKVVHRKFLNAVTDSFSCKQFNNNKSRTNMSKTKLVQSRASGVWIVVYTDPITGKRRKHSTGEKDKNKAFQYLVVHQDELLRPTRQVIKRNEAIKLSEFYEQYSKWSLGQQRKVGDKKHYYSKLIEHFGDVPLESLTVRDLEQFLSTRPTIWVQKHFYEGLAASFQKAVDWEYINVNPWRKIKKPRPPDKLPAYFNKEDFARLIEATPSQLHRDLFVVAAYTGMRAGELQNLKWSNIDFNNKLVIIRNNADFRTKTRKDRAIPMNEIVYEVLTRRHQEFSHEFEYVFFNSEGGKLTHETTSKPLKRAVLKAGLDRSLHFHSLRHTFATWATQSGVPLHFVSKLLGHSTTRMTEKYSHYATETIHDMLNGI